MKFFKQLAALSAISVLAACSADGQNAAVPLPIELTAEAAGHYCQMVILEHDGPKAQMYLDGLVQPLWFSQVRDGLARMKSAERTSEILVLYVNDMGAATSWSEPGVDNWITADNAYFVVGSDAVGGMGAPELVPFADQEKAGAFMQSHGGEILRFADISAELVLAPIDIGRPSQEVIQ